MANFILKKPRSVLALAIGLLLASPSFAESSAADLAIHNLVERAQAAMVSGKPQQAAAYYEQAAGFGESAEAEIGMVRAYLQAGEFRKTIAFANLVAAEHPDVNDTAALLAYLEDREGQTSHALPKLAEALKSHPDDAALMGAYAEILIDRAAIPQALHELDAWIAKNPPQGDIYRLRARAALAAGNTEDLVKWRNKAATAYETSGYQQAAKPLRDWLARMPNSIPKENPSSNTMPPAASKQPAWPAPYFATLPLLTNSSKSGNGFVVDQGRRVVTYASLVANSPKNVWVRNGLGEIREAQVEKVLPEQGLALLRLPQAYPKAWSLPSLALQVPKSVKFCFVFGYSITDSLEASYPLIAPSVVVRPDVGVGGLMQISTALGAESSGSPVFDLSGQLIAITLGRQEPMKGIGDRDSELGKGAFAVRVEVLRSLLPKTAQTRVKRSKAKVANPSIEELYEKFQPAVVAVVVAD
jgi:tetratricopeptide (TPR) repeat protein